jgi:hypothetical protein
MRAAVIDGIGGPPHAQGDQRHAGKRPTRTLLHHVEGSSKTHGVELRGLEPLTPCMQGRCATRLRHSPEIDSDQDISGCCWTWRTVVAAL